ncbi:NAD(P)/FAD-dependent oxidoreductase [Sulfurihydrogenibium yellowstonense]|uniref:Sulfide-quinone reductase n=1 Tax=Sulfurihydrogenibium yellowstonense SS-5 TaxID=432331 RepID=C4FJ15_9AQUI|nr:FAD-dependent oxidoreductase [Sulfurihydrogenibium yellowstonense]EEP60938.1 sulfide-quinone reductase [Sulfurihydrogenibium yellowstonense SS-5]
MAKIVIAGSGFAGHYAALILADRLKPKNGNHEITVVTPNETFNYIPSLIWVGVGQMPVEKTQFPLKPVYDKFGIKYERAFLTEVHPDDNYVMIKPVGSEQEKRLNYDYLLVATGPKLNFDATPGLGPDKGYTYSVCTPPHAVETAKAYLELVKRLEKGDKAKIVIGTGHGTCTCQGAGFEFITNVHKDLVDRGLRDKVELIWLSNEPKLGDFGIDGLEAKKGSLIFTSEMMAEGIFYDYGINYEIRSHVHKVDEKKIYIENLDGEFKEIEYDFAMLLPPFAGQPIKWIDKDGNDIKDKMCNPAGFVKVDAVYGKPYEELDGPDWPKTYQNPTYKNIFAAGIAFAPPGPISKPGKSPNGTIIAPAPPRTGYTAELTGKAAALNIVDMIEGREPQNTASMAETPGLCVASMKNGIFDGMAGTIAIFPVVRNRAKYGEYGRDLDLCVAEPGKAGAWFKLGLHYAFLWKLQGKPFWKLIP